MLQHVNAASAAINTREKDAKISLRCKDSVIFVEGFCADFSVSTPVLSGADCQDFVWGVDYKTLLNLCKYAKKEEIVFTLNTESVTLSADVGGNAFDIRVAGYQKFYERKVDSVALSHCFARNVKDSSDLINAIDSVNYAAARKDTRKHLCGINLR